MQKDNYSFTIRSWGGSNKQNILEKKNNCKLIPSRIRPFGEWYKSRFGDLVTTHECLGGIFCASRTDIHNRPKSFYSDLLDDLTRYNSPNLEESHYIERAWEAILKPKKSSLFIN